MLSCFLSNLVMAGRAYLRSSIFALILLFSTFSSERNGCQGFKEKFEHVSHKLQASHEPLKNTNFYYRQAFLSEQCRHIGSVKFCKRGYFASRINRYSNSTSTFQIIRIVTSGDISPNPGPNKCSGCSKTVSQNHRAVNCESCKLYYHIKCGGVTQKDYMRMKQAKDLSWTCTTCVLSLFVNLPFHDISNSNIEATTHNNNNNSRIFNSDENTYANPDIQQLRKKKRKECMIAHLNINSLPNKFDEIKEWLSSNIFDILSIQETKIDQTFPDSQFTVKGYNLFRCDRKKGGGGILVFVRDSIITVHKKTKSKSVEAIVLDISIGQTKFALIAAYKPPSVENTIFTSDMFSLLDKATSISDNIICIGDLNCDILKPLDNNKQGRCLLDICDVYDLDSLINIPTRISPNRASCLDVILTNVPAYFKESGTFEPGLSDHCLIYTVLNTKLLRPKAQVITVRSFKHFDQESFSNDLSKVPFSSAYVFDDPDDVYWLWEKLYVQVLDDHAPIKSFKRRCTEHSQFITKDIRITIRERNKCKRKFNKSRLLEDWETYRLLRNKVVSMRRKAVQEHFKKLCNDKYSDQKKFWNTIKPYLNSRKKQTTTNERIVLKENNVVIREKQQVAEVLNEYFSSASQKEKNNIAQSSPDLSHIPLNATQKLTITKTNSKEVLNVMKTLKPNKATGHDLIPARAIKESAEILCHPFSTLINYLMDMEKVPQSWKLGEIVPVHKKDCTLTKTNYRPITILPTLSKVFEKLIHSRLSPYFENIYHKYVFAYRKHHGCDTALLSLTEQFKKELDNHRVVGMVSMDLSKAFDSLPHDLMVMKLREYGIDSKTTNLIKDYLTNRYQRVKLNGHVSSWQTISQGIPQGSILGPVLFNIFMNDLCYVIKQSTLFTYADDTQIFRAGDKIEAVEHAINLDLQNVDEWYENNQMKRNHSKYQAIVLGKTKTIPTFKCEDTVIPIKDEIDLLGVTLDNKLKFGSQIRKIGRKVSQQIAVLNRLKKMLPIEIRKDIYRAFITPHFNYCAETWHHCGKRETQKLEKINERALRFVTNDKSTPYDLLTRQLNTSSLLNQRLSKIATTVYKIVHEHGVPQGVKELLIKRNPRYNLRGNDTLQVPKVNTTTYGLKSWRYTATKLWNAIPNTVKIAENDNTVNIAENGNSFRKKLTKLDLSDILSRAIVT